MWSIPAEYVACYCNEAPLSRSRQTLYHAVDQYVGCQRIDTWEASRLYPFWRFGWALLELGSSVEVYGVLAHSAVFSDGMVAFRASRFPLLAARRQRQHTEHGCTFTACLTSASASELREFPELCSCTREVCTSVPAATARSEKSAGLTKFAKPE